MMVLGIDTSCDDTSVGISQDRMVQANVVSSQDEIHAPWGGVVPNLARRAHEENFPLVYQEALQQAGVAENQLEVIAVTYGHGLAIALEVGIARAKELAQRLNLPLVAVNHSEGHILANFAQNRQGEGALDPQEIAFPVLCVLVAGGQTQLVRMSGFGQYEIIGQTVDDAIGEGFDKAARLLGLPYPGGARMSQLAQLGNPGAYDLPRPMRRSGDLDMSYAGLKTAFLHLVQKVQQEHDSQLSNDLLQDLAASYQAAALETLLIKVEKALQEGGYSHTLLGGGVAANQELQQRLAELALRHNSKFHVPYDRKLCTDNGAMIAVTGYFRALEKKFVDSMAALDRDPRLSIVQQ